ncbi:hypothetical protein [Streptococcus danieliae]|uniref:Uncharacterized protein n=1 Tax=Streptococcus danieliae TaxID=747656 RepID=A0A7X3G750_9STRE|nr:hypothetical protein [Streptococcus danieliae]MBF0698817.1 hypothetical protein [Streptococcus danieliae]MCU0081777.1 hypothetical protein [Streptococcus danieliae]MVX58368.1 hypothetical protein [Streptococcus danieliae]NYS95994.1 hypothetical protein [Streptococcus danieliae]
MKKNQTEIKIRGLSNHEVEYLKSMAEQKKFKSFNEFLVAMCREKIEYGYFNGAQSLYLSHLENMKLASDHMLSQLQKQDKILTDLDAKMNDYGQRISRWLEYEGEVENHDQGN